MSTQLSETALTYNLFISVDRHHDVQIESQVDDKLACANLYRFFGGLAEKSILLITLTEM